MLFSNPELGVRTIRTLVAFVFTPVRRSEVGNTSRNRNRFSLDSVGGGGIYGPTVPHPQSAI